ncbi:MAG: YncE family protein [Pirellulaceae bacterium]
MNRTAQSIMLLVSVLAALLGAWLTPRDELLAQDVAISESPAASAYRSPFAVVTSPDGKTIYATDQTGGRLSILDVASMTACGEIELHGRPQGLALSNDGSTLYVAEHGASSVAVIDTNKQTITSRIAVGLWPTAVALGEQSRRLYVANQDRDSISVIDLRQHPAKTITEIAVVREPSSLALTPDERRIVVTNLMALGRGTDPTLSAVVSIIDTGTLAAARSVKLPPGSTMVPGVAVSPDGKWAYVVHGLGRFNLPITQLERGWVNTNALSIIDIAGGSRLATLLLDDLMQGAADPHSLVVSQDGKHLWITHTGVHEVSSIDIGLVHELLEGNVPDDLASLKDGSQANIWNQVKHNREKIADLENDLTGLYIAGVIHRFRARWHRTLRAGSFPPMAKRLFVANYFSVSVTVLDASTGSLQRYLAGSGTGPRLGGVGVIFARRDAATISLMRVIYSASVSPMCSARRRRSCGFLKTSASMGLLSCRSSG